MWMRSPFAQYEVEGMVQERIDTMRREVQDARLGKLAYRERGGKIMKNRIFLAMLALVLLVTSCAQPAARPALDPVPSTADLLPQFEAELEGLRQQLKIPGLSAAIVEDQELVWAQGLGYADLENQVAATPETPYRLASVTKPIAATLIMQLVEEGVLALDDPVSNYGVHLESEGEIKVWHLLTHTSEGVPGTRHNYNGDRYSYLGAVVEAASGKPFAELLRERILAPVGMTDTAPSYPACALESLLTSPDAGAGARNDVRVNRELARPYQLDPSYNIVAGSYPAGFSPAAGLISTVVDLAEFDIALDRGTLLGAEAKTEMFEPAVSTYQDRADLMYALGWYSQDYRDTRLLWHTGRWLSSVSALYLKVPGENMTFIVLANTAHLSTPFPLGQGDVLYSTLAQTFYRTFVFPRQQGKTVPRMDWTAAGPELVAELGQVKDKEVRQVLERELWSYRQLFASVGRADLADRLQGVHGQVYGASRANALDLHTFQGVEYHPVVSAQVELGEAALGRFVGRYALTEAPEAAREALPVAVTLELKQGELLGVAPDKGCLSLVAIAPARFAIPENPDLELEFHMAGDRVEKLMVEAGPIVAVYTPVP